MRKETMSDDTGICDLPSREEARAFADRWTAWSGILTYDLARAYADGRLVPVEDVIQPDLEAAAEHFARRYITEWYISYERNPDQAMAAAREAIAALVDAALGQTDGT